MPDAPTFGGFRKMTPVVKGTLIVLGVAFLFLAIQARFAPEGESIAALLTLNPSRVLRGERPWTIVTYALVHSLESPWHILFNGMVLYFFGSDLETRFGKVRFGAYMLTAVVGGAAVTLLAAWLKIGGAPILGASAICEAAVVTWALMNRDKEVFLFFFRVKGITLLYITVGLAVLDGLTNSGVSAAAHFGGILVGAVWALFMTGRFRERMLRRRLKRLETERDAVVTSARRAARADLRVIPGGRGRDDDPKRYLN